MSPCLYRASRMGNLYWHYYSAPGRTARVTDTKEVSFTD